MEFNGYDLSRKWFNFCFSNPEKVKPIHTALYFFAIEHCNRLGWKDKFGFPTSMAMDAIGVKTYNTYINALNDLVVFGFVKLVQRSKNQYSSNIIALNNFNKALDKALDRAFIEHSETHNDKPIKEKKVKEEIIYKDIVFELQEWSKSFFHFKYINDKSLKVFDMLLHTDKYNVEDIKSAIVFARNDSFWTTNFISPLKLRNKDKNGVKYIDVFLAKILKNSNNGKFTNNGSSKQQGCTYEELAEVLHEHFD